MPARSVSGVTAFLVKRRRRNLALVPEQRLPDCQISVVFGGSVAILWNRTEGQLRVLELC